MPCQWQAPCVTVGASVVAEVGGHVDGMLGGHVDRTVGGHVKIPSVVDVRVEAVSGEVAISLVIISVQKPAHGFRSSQITPLTSHS